MSEIGTPNVKLLKEREDNKAKIRQIDAQRGAKQKELDDLNTEIAMKRKLARKIAKEIDSLG